MCSTTFASPTVLEVFRYEGLVTHAYVAIVELKYKHGLMSKTQKQGEIEIIVFVGLWYCQRSAYSEILHTFAENQWWETHGANSPGSFIYV